MVDPISATLFIGGLAVKKVLIRGGLVVTKAVVAGAKIGALKGGAVYTANHAAAIHAFSIAHAAALKSIMIGTGCVAAGALTMEIFDKLAVMQTAGVMTPEKTQEIGSKLEQMSEKEKMEFNDKMDNLLKEIM